MTDNDWVNVEHWLEVIITECQDRLNEWESTFIDGMDKLFEEGKEFTQPQMDKIHQIYEQYTK